MNICFLTQTLNPQTGTGVFAAALLEGVRSHYPHYEVSVLTGEDCLKPQLFSLLKNFMSIRKKVRRADLVHALDAYPYGVIAALALFGTSRPLIITAIGSGSLQNLRGRGWKSRLLRWSYRRASYVTAISQYVAQEIKKVLPGLTIEVINPGVDYEFYSKEEERTPDAEYPYIVTQGEFKRRKGYREMLPIVKRVMERKKDLRYVIVANTTLNPLYRDKLYELMEELEMRDRVIIKSSLTREELRDTYSKAVVYFTLPQNYGGDVEGFGMAIMEAAATGVPAVVGRGSGADDAVLHGQSGFLVEGNNSTEVLEKILSIIDNKDLRNRLSSGARSWARGNTWSSKIPAYLNLYEKI
jgi:glycosyltransferase involved in cell wall biosynthesis